jgi:hypothetical protein
VFAPPVVFAGPWTAQHSFADIDQDGDLDLCGWKTVRNRTFEGATAGFHRQYGNGSAGTGGRRPLLSVTGTVRAGLTPSIRLCNVPGATVGVLLVGSGPDNSPSPVLPGIQAYVSGLFLLLGSAATGAPGVPGAGVIEVPVAIPPGIGGTSLFLEYLVFDPASPTSLTHSNGCELHVGQ